MLLRMLFIWMRWYLCRMWRLLLSFVRRVLLRGFMLLCTFLLQRSEYWLLHLEFNQHSSAPVDYSGSNFVIFNHTVIIFYARLAVGRFMFLWRFFWSRFLKTMWSIMPANDTLYFGVSSYWTLWVLRGNVRDLLRIFWMPGLVFFDLLQCSYRCVDINVSQKLFIMIIYYYIPIYFNTKDKKSSTFFWR